MELSSGLASVSRALAAHTTNRANKVQQLTTDVQSGAYNPDSMAISQSMVAQALGAQ
ncbi:MAG: flagellar biosynthesis anti-sigma factor FlgM [Ignavibacteriota bacterium]